MSFNLITKLKDELRQLQTDLRGYSDELDQLTKSRSSAITEANQELQRALDTFDRKINELGICINNMKSAVEQYEYTLGFLEKIEGKNNNVNG